jgi:hypothetical protein
VARLAVTVIGHVLGARRAHVVFDILVEDCERAGDEVRHHIFADEPAPGDNLIHGIPTIIDRMRLKSFFNFSPFELSVNCCNSNNNLLGSDVV